MKKYVSLFTTCTLLMFGTHSFAGILFVETESDNEDGLRFTQTRPVYSIEYSSSHLAVDGTAITATTEEDFILQKGGSVTGYLVLPAGAEIDRIQLTLGGKATQVEAVKEVDSEALLTRLVRESRLEALAPHRGSRLIELPLNGKSGKGSVSVTWKAQAREKDGVLSFTAPIPLSSLASAPTRRAVVKATMRNDLPLRAIFSPTHESSVTRTSATEADVRMSIDGLRDDTPFELIAVTGADELGLRLFTHRQESIDEGYFILVGCATDRAISPAPKEIVFVVDTSGSMRGDKMEQARAALEYCLNQLKPSDHFNIIGFSDEIASLNANPVPANKQNVEAAQAFLDQLEPNGRTNIGDALVAAISDTREDEEEARERLVIFLTDGAPTVGERRPDAILSKVQEVNVSNARIFTLGIGHQINAYLLDRLAVATKGDSGYVEPGQDLDETVAALYNRLANPILSNVASDFGELDVSALTPMVIPDLFRDNLLMIAGRFKKSGTGTVEIYDRKTDRGFSQKITFPETDMEHAFIAPLWAARRLGDAIEQVRLHGESDEALEEIVNISRRYGIITEYTALINEGQSDALTDRQVVEQVKAEVSRARQSQTGKWAVMQSLNEKGLKSRVACNVTDNTFMDAQGQVQQASNIRQIGNTAFYCRDGVWKTADDGKQRISRTVEKFSEEYFELMKTNKDFSKAASLGADVTINIGEEQIRVK